MIRMIDQIGGELVLMELVDTFYQLMETHPRGGNLRHLHFSGKGFNSARVEQYNFLSGFLGGRQHFMEKHGHMNVKLVHEHIPITSQDAEDWLFLMEAAMGKCDIDEKPKCQMIAAFRNVAFVLVNEGEVVVR